MKVGRLCKKRLAKTPKPAARLARVVLILLVVGAVAYLSDVRLSGWLPGSDSDNAVDESGQGGGDQIVAQLRAEDYFPAEPGMRWTYEGWGNEFAAYQRVVTHRRGSRAQIVHVSGAAVAFVYDIEPGTIVLRAMSAEIEDETADYLDAPDELRRVILQEPLAVGAEWRTPSWTRLSTLAEPGDERVSGAPSAEPGANGSDEGRERSDDRFVWETRRIEAVGETLTTPAGTFRNVIRVRVIPDEGVESLEHYALGVGLIKSEYLYEFEPIVSALSSFRMGRE